MSNTVLKKHTDYFPFYSLYYVPPGYKKFDVNTLFTTHNGLNYVQILTVDTEQLTKIIQEQDSTCVSVVIVVRGTSEVPEDGFEEIIQFTYRIPIGLIFYYPEINDMPPLQQESQPLAYKLHAGVKQCYTMQHDMLQLLFECYKHCAIVEFKAPVDTIQTHQQMSQKKTHNTTLRILFPCDHTANPNGVFETGGNNQKFGNSQMKIVTDAKDCDLVMANAVNLGQALDLYIKLVGDYKGKKVLVLVDMNITKFDQLGDMKYPPGMLAANPNFVMYNSAQGANNKNVRDLETALLEHIHYYQWRTQNKFQDGHEEEVAKKSFQLLDTFKRCLARNIGDSADEIQVNDTFLVGATIGRKFLQPCIAYMKPDTVDIQENLLDTDSEFIGVVNEANKSIAASATSKMVNSNKLVMLVDIESFRQVWTKIKSMDVSRDAILLYPVVLGDKACMQACLYDIYNTCAHTNKVSIRNAYEQMAPEIMYSKSEIEAVLNRTNQTDGLDCFAQGMIGNSYVFDGVRPEPFFTKFVARQLKRHSDGVSGAGELAIDENLHSDDDDVYDDYIRHVNEHRRNDDDKSQELLTREDLFSLLSRKKYRNKVYADIMATELNKRNPSHAAVMHCIARCLKKRPPPARV